ncbi:hypothetical protein [Streptomyces sp. NPDC018000]|uniref:hypothetical protein n=1 Tax=Streptomyces sp. NPDC018000 TaxID=3365028 RepID=UPI00379A8E53
MDKHGTTVYRFKKDVAWPMKPACTGVCLSKWPVVAAIGEEKRQRRHDQGLWRPQSARRNQTTSPRLPTGPYLIR